MKERSATMAGLGRKQKTSKMGSVCFRSDRKLGGILILMWKWGILTDKKSATDPKFRKMLNKVPEVTLYFWIIKILCTTVGETAADFLSEKLRFGLTDTSLLMGGVLVIVLIFQFRAPKYIPWMYWLSVVLLSVVGTLITDNLTDNFGVELTTSTWIFSAALVLTFAAWFWSEKTLSIHSIVTSRRESFYWLAILFTFALGTASGDLIAEQYKIGYLPSALIFAGAIGLITAAHYSVRGILKPGDRHRSTHAILAFWLAYILTRPLGASVGDYLSQPCGNGGLGLGATTTSVIFLAAILGLVVYLTVSRRDEITDEGN